MHQGQVLGPPGQPPVLKSQATPEEGVLNGAMAPNGVPVAGVAQSHVTGAPLVLSHASADASSINDLVGAAARAADTPEVKPPNASDGKKDKKAKDKATKLIYSDEWISPEEKMASLPRYAFVPRQ